MLKSKWVGVFLAAIAGSLGGVMVWHFGIEPGRRGAATEEAMAMLKAQEAAWNRGDLAGFLSAYEMNDAITFFSDDKVTKGWVAINDRYTNSYGQKPNLMGKLSFTELAGEAFNANTVQIRGRWTVTESAKAGTGLFTILVKKTGDGWRVVHDHTSVRKEEKP